MGRHVQGVVRSLPALRVTIRLLCPVVECGGDWAIANPPILSVLTDFRDMTKGMGLLRWLLTIKEKYLDKKHNGEITISCDFATGPNAYYRFVDLLSTMRAKQETEYEETIL